MVPDKHITGTALANEAPPLIIPKMARCDFVQVHRVGKEPQKSLKSSMYEANVGKLVEIILD